MRSHVSIARRAAAVLVLALVGALTVAASPAAAADDGHVSAVPGETVTDTIVDRKCQKQAARVGERWNCEIVVSLTAGELKPVTPEELEAAGHGDLRADDGTRLSDAVGTSNCGVFYSNWSHDMQSKLDGLFWKETHNGRYYLDTCLDLVWSTEGYGGLYGYHNCGNFYGNGIVYNNLRCKSEHWRDGTGLREHDCFRIHATYQGSPFTRSYAMHVTMRSNGRYNSYYDDYCMAP